MESLQQSIANAPEEDTGPSKVAQLLTAEFDELVYAASGDRDALAKKLIGKLRTVDVIPLKSREQVALVLHAKMGEWVDRDEVFEGKTIAGHTLNALLTLGYPWALQVDPKVAERVAEAQPYELTDTARANRRRIAAFLLGSLFVTGFFFWANTYSGTNEVAGAVIRAVSDFTLWVERLFL